MEYTKDFLRWLFSSFCTKDDIKSILNGQSINSVMDMYKRSSGKSALVEHKNKKSK